VTKSLASIPPPSQLGKKFMQLPKFFRLAFLRPVYSSFILIDSLLRTVTTCPLFPFSSVLGRSIFSGSFVRLLTLPRKYLLRSPMFFNSPLRFRLRRATESTVPPLNPNFSCSLDDHPLFFALLLLFFLS